MHEANPLSTAILFQIGPIPIAVPVVTTWLIMTALVLVSWIGLRNAKLAAGGLQAFLEIVVETVDNQITEIIGKANAQCRSMLTTLFLFLACANLSAIVPGTSAPTAHLETPAALALIVFLSAHYFGIQAQGLGTYLRHYSRPNVFLTPLNVLAELTRTFSLMVRLFGNMMSHELVVAIIAVLAGLLVPVPFLLLGVLIGLIQAYIFTVLASVYLGAATGSISVE